MPALTTFAFLNPVDAETLAAVKAAAPGVEFLAPEGRAGIPAGIERAQAAALSWGGPPIDEVLAAAPQLRWLHQRGAGIDLIATPRLAASGVLVTNGSGNHAINIAEHVLGLMLAFARQFPALMRAQAEARWAPPKPAQLFELSGQTLAVIGAGTLGEAIAVRAAALGMRVVGVRRSGAKGDHGVTTTTPGAPGAPAALAPGFEAMHGPAALDAVLGSADHVVITLPLTRETRGLFGAGRIAAMKPGAYLYNVGRGAIVQPDALLAAVRSGQLGGAGLDVTEPEPLPASSPLWREPNVVITAHSSGLTPKSLERYRELLVENLRRWLASEPLRNVVHVSRGY